MGKGESSAPVLHTVGSRVWLACDQEGWVPGEVLKIEDPEHLTVRLANGNERICSQDEIPLQNPGIRGVEVRPGQLFACTTIDTKLPRAADA